MPRFRQLLGIYVPQLLICEVLPERVEKPIIDEDLVVVGPLRIFGVSKDGVLFLVLFNLLVGHHPLRIIFRRLVFSYLK